jgi:hypothetical protein
MNMMLHGIQLLPRNHQNGVENVLAAYEMIIVEGVMRAGTILFKVVLKHIG